MEPTPKGNFGLSTYPLDLCTWRASGVLPAMKVEGPGHVSQPSVDGTRDLFGGYDGGTARSGGGNGDGDRDGDDRVFLGQSWTVMEIFWPRMQ